MLADEARGIVKVAASELREMGADGGPLLFSHTFHHPVTGSAISVLDVPTVQRLPGVPTVHDPVRVVSVSASAATPGSETSTVTLLRGDDHLLGIGVEHVHTTLGDARVSASVLDSVLCHGVTEYRDMEVPVVDPLVLLGLGRRSAEASVVGVVLDFGHGYVVLALSSVVDIVSLPDDDVLSLPAFSVRRPELVAGIAAVEGVGQCLMLDGEALLADENLQALAAMNTPVGDSPANSVAASHADAFKAGEDGQRRGSGVAREYLSYCVGSDVVTALEQISEIVPVPPIRTSTQVGDAVLGVAVHRSSAVPVLCLPTLLGLPRRPATSASCLLLVDVDGDQVGFAVHALRSIDPLAWAQRKADEEVDATDGPTGLELDRALERAPLVSGGADTRLLPDLDLRAVARARLGGQAVGAGTGPTV